MKEKKDQITRFNEANRNTGCCVIMLFLLSIVTTAACCFKIQWLVALCVIAIIIGIIALVVWSSITDDHNPSSWTPVDGF